MDKKFIKAIKIFLENKTISEKQILVGLNHIFVYCEWPSYVVSKFWILNQANQVNRKFNRKDGPAWHYQWNKTIIKEWWIYGRRIN